MKATVMYGAGDVRVEIVPDARIIEPTDAVVTVTRACICGSDLDVLEDRFEPGRVFDRVTNLDGVPDGYRAMNDRESIKVMIAL
jgi:threonine dehydrogenase-like Zn-dependent dehydrogenase